MKYSFALFCLAALLPLTAKADIISGTNAIVNGNAETGTTSGWSGANFTTETYTGGGFPTQTSPGPADRGKYFFGGGNNNAFASGTQTISVANLGTSIDSGNVSFLLSGYFGGYFNQRDFASLEVEFLSASNGSLGSDTIGGVTPAERNNVTGLLFDSSTGTLPVGTRSLEFLLSMTRFDGDYDDGYADNLSFVATEGTEPPPPPPPPVMGTTPEPSSVVLLASGALGFAAEHWRRRKSRGARAI